MHIQAKMIFLLIIDIFSYYYLLCEVSTNSDKNRNSADKHHFSLRLGTA